MNFTQRSHTERTTFHFEQEVLVHSRSDIHGAHCVRLPYGSIGMDPRVVTERIGTLFIGAVILLVWGCIAALHSALHADWSGIVFLLPGPICLLLYAFSSTTVTYLNSDDGELAIFHDNNHDQIMSEIREHRKKQLLDWYGNINFANDPEDEIRKFHWLHSQNLISADQLQRIVTTIRDADTRDQDTLIEVILPRQ